MLVFIGFPSFPMDLHGSKAERPVLRSQDVARRDLVCRRPLLSRTLRHRLGDQWIVAWPPPGTKRAP